MTCGYKLLSIFKNAYMWLAKNTAKRPRLCQVPEQSMQSASALRAVADPSILRKDQEDVDMPGLSLRHLSSGIIVCIFNSSYKNYAARLAIPFSDGC